MSFGSHSLVDWFIRSHILYIYEYNNTFVKFDFMASIFDLFLGWSFVSAAAYIACTWLSCGTGKYLGYVHFQSFLKREAPSTDNYVCKSVRPIWRLALWRLLLLDWLGFYECLFALPPRLFFAPKTLIERDTHTAFMLLHSLLDIYWAFLIPLHYHLLFICPKKP